MTQHELTGISTYFMRSAFDTSSSVADFAPGILASECPDPPEAFEPNLTAHFFRKIHLYLLRIIK